MFAGKSEALRARLKHTGYINKKIVVIKPELDTRTEREIFSMLDDGYINKYKHLSKHAISNNAQDFRNLVDSKPFDVIAIDEVQFFGMWLVDEIERLLEKDDKLVILVHGLAEDYEAKKWGPMYKLEKRADKVTVLTATCHKCEKRPAHYTYKIGGADQRIEIGGKQLYEARCYLCHSMKT